MCGPLRMRGVPRAAHVRGRLCGCARSSRVHRDGAAHGDTCRPVDGADKRGRGACVVPGAGVADGDAAGGPARGATETASVRRAVRGTCLLQNTSREHSCSNSSAISFCSSRFAEGNAPGETHGRKMWAVRGAPPPLMVGSTARRAAQEWRLGMWAGGAEETARQTAGGGAQGDASRSSGASVGSRRAAEAEGRRPRR